MEETRESEALFRAVTLFAGGTASLALAVSKAALPVSAAQMVRIANELGGVADNYGISKVALLYAADQLLQSDSTTRSEAVAALIHECVVFAHDAANAEHDDLMRSAIDLALAGRCFLRVAALGSTERPAASQQPAGVVGWRVCVATWWSKWMRRTKVDDLEELLLEKTAPTSDNSAVASSSSSSKSKGCQSDNWSAIHLSCLGGSLALFPYIGKDGLLKDEEFSDDYRNTVGILLMVWWCLVAFGIMCSLFGRSWFEFQYARFSAYLGVFGISVLVTMFLHWLLVIKAMVTLYCLLGCAGPIFLVHWIWSCLGKG